MNEAQHSRRLGRSIWAMFAGFLVGAGLSLGTDGVMHLLKIYPAWGERMSDGLFVLATVYRIAYSILGAYIVARLAPDRPMWHAMVLGCIGFVLSVAGAVATWNRRLRTALVSRRHRCDRDPVLMVRGQTGDAKAATSGVMMRLQQLR